MSNKLEGGIVAGSVDVSIPVILRATEDNTGVTGKDFNDATGSYWRQGGIRVDIPCITLAAVNSAHDDGGFKEVDATNMPGSYRFDLPDAAIDTGADWVVIAIKVAGAYLFYQLFHLTVSLTTRAPAGEYDTELDANMSTRATSAKQDTMETTLNDVPTTAEFNARTIAAADYLVEGDTLARVTLVDTVTTNTDLVSAADIKTAMEADGGDLSSLMEALVNKRVWTEVDGNLEMFNDAGASQGNIPAQVASDGDYTTAKRAFIAVP